MSILGDVVGFVSNPVGGIVGGVVGIASLQLWRIVKKQVSPISYIRKGYEGLDKVVEEIDNRLIDKIFVKKLKGKIQEDVKLVLQERKKKIEELIKRISD